MIICDRAVVESEKQLKKWESNSKKNEKITAKEKGSSKSYIEVLFPLIMAKRPHFFPPGP